MSTLVISDTHLTKKFDQKLYNKLVELINKHDNIILNGDFWEGLQITFEEFLNSKWNILFPLLKEKKAVYIYGNHDRKIYSDERVALFCEKAAENLQLEINDKKYFLTHGDQLVLPSAKEIRSIESVRSKSSVYFEKVCTVIQKYVIKVFGPNTFPEFLNKFTKQERDSIADINSIIVCGHSHKQQYKSEMNFVDIGFFNYDWANYLVIDENGSFTLHQESYS